MRIDETGHHNSMSRVDYFTVCAHQVFNLAPPANGFDMLSAHQHRAIFDDRELTQLATTTWMTHTGKRDQL